MERSRVTLNTIAVELVPPNVEDGRERPLEDARKVARYSAESGLDGQIRHLMIPGMIAEEDDRPVAMKPKLDVLDFWSIIKPELPGFNGLELQRELLETPIAIPIVFITGHGDIPTSVKAMKAGAVDFLPKPFND